MEKHSPNQPVTSFTIAPRLYKTNTRARKHDGARDTDYPLSTTTFPSTRLAPLLTTHARTPLSTTRPSSHTTIHLELTTHQQHRGELYHHFLFFPRKGVFGA